MCVYHSIYIVEYRLYSCRSSLALWFSILQSDLVSNLRLKTVQCRNLAHNQTMQFTLDWCVYVCVGVVV